MKKRFSILMLVMLFSIGLAGCETWDRYSPFASKTDVYGVVKEEAKRDSQAPKDIEAYDYNLIGYDKDLNKIELGFGSGNKFPVGTYIKAVKKGSDTRMHDVTVIKKEDVPKNILKKLSENEK
ncbi:YxeA family protein [Bacillus sp. C1]